MFKNPLNAKKNLMQFEVSWLCILLLSHEDGGGGVPRRCTNIARTRTISLGLVLLPGQRGGQRCQVSWWRMC